MGSTTCNFFTVTVTIRKRPEKLTVEVGAYDKRQIVEEPCELETLTHGSEAKPERRRSGLEQLISPNVT